MTGGVGLYGNIASSPRPPRPEISSALLDHSSTHKVFADLVSEYHMAIQEITELRWSQIGVEDEEGGGTRPLYRMRNPNAKIVELVDRCVIFCLCGSLNLFVILFALLGTDIIVSPML